MGGDSVYPEGIDVSSYQGGQYGTAGRGFVFVKATEGTGYVNPRHAAQVATGRGAGLVVGHYHFARPGDMAAQVRYFLAHATPAPGDVLCLDWEDTGVSSAGKDAFLQYLKWKMPGHRSVLYCNRDFWLNRDRSSFAGDGLWIADPDAPAGQPRIQHPWLFHQYGETNGLDLDIANFPTQAALAAWAAGTTPTPTPENTMSLTPADREFLWAYSHGDKPDVHQTLASAEAQTRSNGSMLSALASKVDALAATVAKQQTPPQIDYTKLAAALIAQLKGA